MEQLSKLLQTWKKQRRLYPGWVIVPEDRRSELWLYTEKWLSYLPTGDDLPSLVDLEFAFELNWRMEKCLCPILDNQVEFLESTLNRYLPFTDLKTPVESASRDAKRNEGTRTGSTRYQRHVPLSTYFDDAVLPRRGAYRKMERLMQKDSR